MKAAPLGYARATSVDGALELLSSLGDRAKVLSGGQSLMPAMNLRLISPELLVDIGGITELRDISVRGDTLHIGALVRHVDLQHSPEVAEYAPLLTEAVAEIAHPAIRNRGTLGGSLAHADPAAELPACMLALGATIITRGKNGERRIAADDFFRGIFQTAMSADELLVAVELPIASKGSIHYFHEFARRHGDFAIVGLAAQAVVEDGMFSSLRVAFFGVGDRPVLASVAKGLLNVAVTPDVISQASAKLSEELDPQDDQQASGAMRLHLARVLLGRCMAALLSRDDLAGGPA
jgi:aerobic carbon-monoxide dehydrogenase medium subunit